MGFQNGWRGPDIVADGLVLYLDAGSPNSYRPDFRTTWKDMSGFNNSGSLVNGPTYDSANGGSIFFDGADDYVDTVSGSSTVALTSEVSICCWFKTAMISQGGFARQIGTSDNGVELQISSGGKIGGAAFLSGWQNFPTSSLSYNDNTWHNAVVTINGTLITVYADNSIVYSGSLGLGSLNTGNGKVRIGLHPNGTANKYNGRIASVLLYTKALSSTEVQQNYNAQKSRFGL